MANRVLNKQLNEKLDGLLKRPNNRYNRGILHGFLLALTTEGRLDNDEAIAILDEFREKEEVEA